MQPEIIRYHHLSQAGLTSSGRRALRADSNGSFGRGGWWGQGEH